MKTTRSQKQSAGAQASVLVGGALVSVLSLAPAFAQDGPVVDYDLRSATLDLTKDGLRASPESATSAGG
ncbi:MAG: hypothetical protein AAFO75_04440, partial [Pseudomonadota bacterium]